MAFMDKDSVAIHSIEDGSVLYECKVDQGIEKLYRMQAALEKAVSEGVDLSYADLKGIVLEKADLKNGKFKDAVFSGSVMKDVDFRGADLTSTSFVECELDGVGFDDARMADVDLHMSKLGVVSFSDADLRNANFIGTKVIYGDFHRADLNGAHLFGADISNSSFSHAEMKLADDLSRVKIESTDFEQVNVSAEFKEKYNDLFRLSKDEVIELRINQKWEYVKAYGQLPPPMLARNDVENLKKLVESQEFNKEFELPSREYDLSVNYFSDKIAAFSKKYENYKEVAVAALKDWRGRSSLREANEITSRQIDFIENNKSPESVQGTQQVAIRSIVDNHILYECKVDKNIEPRFRVQAALEKAVSEGVDLSRADLRYLSLKGADLTNGKFEEACFVGSTMEHVSFVRADLQLAAFSECKMDGVYYHGAKLSYASFYDAKLNLVDFIDADLRSVSFAKADVKRVDFHIADLNEAQFDRSNIENSAFSYVNIENTYFKNVVIKDTGFIGARVSSEFREKYKDLFVLSPGGEARMALSGVNIEKEISSAGIGKKSLGNYELTDEEIKKINPKEFENIKAQEKELDGLVNEVEKARAIGNVSRKGKGLER